MSVAESLRSIEGIELTGNDVQRKSLSQRKYRQRYENDERNAVSLRQLRRSSPNDDYGENPNR